MYKVDRTNSKMSSPMKCYTVSFSLSRGVSLQFQRASHRQTTTVRNTARSDGKAKRCHRAERERERERERREREGERER